LWQKTGPGTFNMRGWPSWVRSGPPPPDGKLACVRGINEVAIGTAVNTKILYDVIPEAEDCQPAERAQRVVAFVRGLTTPVELSDKEQGASKTLSCDNYAKDKSTDSIRHIWSCKIKSTKLMDVIIAVARSDKDQTSKDRPNLSLSDPVGSGILEGPISIDETIIPTKSDGDLVLPKEVNIGCYDKSISVLITTEEDREERTWAYVVATAAVEQFLANMAAKNPHLQDKDPIKLVEDPPDWIDWLLTVPSLVFYGILDRIKNTFQDHTPLLCS
jgi:hypothetical protein